MTRSGFQRLSLLSICYFFLIGCLTVTSCRYPFVPPSEPYDEPPGDTQTDTPPATPVEPEASPLPEPQTIHLPPLPKIDGLPTIHFTIQVGAFSTVLRAAGYADRLETAGLDAFYFIDTDKLYKVRFERFDTKEAAHARAQALKQSGVIEDFYIVRPGRPVKPGKPAPAVDVKNTLRDDLVATARRFLGIPYRWGGASPEKGFDCSGLTMTVYRLNGLDLPRNAYSQYKTGKAVNKNEMGPGDLVFFATNGGPRVSHVGIYSGQGKFIHAPRRGKRIRISSLSSPYYRQRYKGARRYF